MSLEPGHRLGPYEIIAPLGAGGMGEVYRARDERLQRDVAIKVLPVAVAGDPERLARFEREARALAQLLADPFFAQAPPKSTGRERFGIAFAERLSVARRPHVGQFEVSFRDADSAVAAAGANAAVSAYLRVVEERDDEQRRERAGEARHGRPSRRRYRSSSSSSMRRW